MSCYMDDVVLKNDIYIRKFGDFQCAHLKSVYVESLIDKEDYCGSYIIFQDKAGKFNIGHCEGALFVPETEKIKELRKH